LDGAFEHEDFCGHKGRINSGDLQWMTAGKGIVHSEMPAPDSDKISHGLQLWVNLPAKDKLCEPQYQELKASEITTVDNGAGVTAVVIAGEALGHKSKVYTRNPTHYIHFKMQPNSRLEHRIPVDHNAFVYILNGEGTFSGQKCEAHHVLTLKSGGDGIIIETANQKTDFVLLSAKPIGEPVVQHGKCPRPLHRMIVYGSDLIRCVCVCVLRAGPFVMNTQQEIYKAMQDYSAGKNGFEKAPGWKSIIGKPITDRYHDDDDI